LSVDGDAGEPLFDPNKVNIYAEPEALLADEQVQLVSICTYTDTHADLAVRGLEAGKHVLIEKPVAIAPAEVERVADAAVKAGGQACMPAMCMRFWPGWSWLKEQIERRTFGPVRSASFQRLGSRPDWATEFYRDDARCGAALVDLHIHDADFIRWCFGDPDAVVSTGTVDHVTTMYRYRSGPSHVLAEGGWGQAAGFPFRMRYVVNFAEATADFDLGRAHPLMLSQAGESQPVPVPSLTGYDLEIRHLLDAISRGGLELTATIEDAVAVARLLEAERRSLETATTVAL
jgi:predicted dehydrogenase